MFSPIKSANAIMTNILAYARQHFDVAGLGDNEVSKLLETVLNVFESLPICINAIARATTTSEVVLAFAMTFKLITRKNIISSAVHSYAWIEEQLQAFGSDLVSDSTEVQSGSQFDWCVEGAKSLLSFNALRSVKNGIEVYKNVRKCAFVSKIQQILCYFVSFGIISNLKIKECLFGVREFQANFRAREFESLEGFILCMLENTIWFVERAAQAVSIGSFSPFLHNADSYSEWIELAHKVILDQHKMQNPEAFKEEGFDCSKFHGDLDKVLEHGEAMLKIVVEPREKSMISRILMEIKMISIKFKSKDYAQRDRKPPFAILVVGDSKIAKTNFTQILFQHYGKVHGKDIDPSCMWTRNSLDKFYSGYAVSKWCIRLDDIAQFNPQLGTLDPTMADVIMIINGVTLVAPMADISDKGVIPVKPELVIATTNQKNLNAHAYFSCPLAVRRRFPYIIELEIKDDFCATDKSGNKTTMVDESKIPLLNPGEYMNIWNITLSKIVAAKPNKESAAIPTVEVVSKFRNINDFLQFYANLTKEFGKHQSLSEQAVTQMATVDLCMKCYRPQNDCSCQPEGRLLGRPAVQSGERDTLWNDEDLRAYFEEHGVLPDEHVNFVNDVYSNMEVAIRLQNDGSYISIHGPFTQRTDTVRMPLQSGVVEIEPLEGEVDTEDRRSVLNKCLDWVDDSMDVVHAFGAMLAVRAGILFNDAYSIGVSLKEKGCECSSSVVTLIGDVLILYQLRKYKNMFAELGEKIAHVWRTKKIEIVCGMILIGWSLYKTVGYVSDWLHSSDKSEIQGQEMSAPFRMDVKENPWLNEEVPLSDFFVPSRSSGWAKLPQDKVIAMVRQNVVHIDAQYKTYTGMKHIPAVALCVVGHLYVTNNHCMPKNVRIELSISDRPQCGVVSPNHTIILSEESLFRIPSHDLVFFVDNCTVPRADLTGLFFKKQFKGLSCKGVYIHCRDNGYSVNDLAIFGPEQTKVLDPEMTTWMAKPNVPTLFGDCGSPAIAFSPMGPIIVGLHQFLLKDGGIVGSAEIIKADIDCALARFGPQIQCGEPSFKDEILGPLHRKSTVNWVRGGVGMVYGSNTKANFRSNSKSKVTKTAICDAAEEEGFKRKTFAPVMQGPEIWHNNIQPILTQTFLADQGVIDKCVDDYVERIITGLSQQDLNELVVLSDMETANGIAGVKFIDKLNRNTSMGYPHHKSKRHFLEIMAATEAQPEPMMYSEEIMREVRNIEEVYKSGRRYMPVFTMCMKDEPVPLKKVEIKKTRGFSVGPAAFQFVERKYLLAFVRIFQLNPFLFEGMPGMNCNSCSWKKLYKYLVHFGVDQIIAGDYEKFDKRMSPAFIKAAFKVISRILRHAGFSEEDLRVVDAIAEDVAFPNTLLQGDFVEFFGSNPSGHALTVIINCIVNSLYMRYAWHQMMNKGLVTLKDFNTHVNLATYGDDNAMGVHRNAAWFNHTSIQEQLKAIGVVYTMADKHTASIPFVNISEISFLKRKFVPQENGRIACPLDWESVEKMLTSCVPSKTLGPEAQAIATIRSAIMESWQYGPDKFAETTDKMHRIIQRSGIQDFVLDCTFPSDEVLAYSHYRSCIYDCDECALETERLRYSVKNMDRVERDLASDICKATCIAVQH